MLLMMIVMRDVMIDRDAPDGPHEAHLILVSSNAAAVVSFITTATTKWMHMMVKEMLVVVEMAQMGVCAGKLWQGGASAAARRGGG